MRILLWPLLVFLSVSTAAASSIIQYDVETLVDKADVVAHVRPQKIETQTIENVFCGFLYTVEVVESFKGGELDELTFISAPSGNNLGMSEDAIVFLHRAPLWNEYGYSGEDEQYARERAEGCSPIAPALSEMRQTAMRYTSAKVRKLKDEDYEILELNQNLDINIRRWHDEFFMVEIPGAIDPESLNDVRTVSFREIYANDKKIPIEAYEEFWRVPLEMVVPRLLFPAKEMKRIVREHDISREPQD